MYCIRYTLLTILASAVLAFYGVNSVAQSSSLYNGFKYTQASDTTFEYSEYLYIGPDAKWEIQGVHVVYSAYIWIAPGATIEGSGKLLIAKPASNTFYSYPLSATHVDGNNGNYIDLTVEHHNPSNVILANIDDPGFDIAEPSGSSSAALKIGKEINLMIDDGDIILNDHDFYFGPDAAINNYSSERMVVTSNSIGGHMIKVNTTPYTFTFPVGIEERDYTPAIISGENTYFVSVQDYNNSPSDESAPGEGMDRTWHVYGGSADSVTLIHNTDQTNGNDYIDANAFITRYGGNKIWSTGTPEQIGDGVHLNTLHIPIDLPSSASDSGAFLTKTSDALTPLPFHLVQFNVLLQGKNALIQWQSNNDAYCKEYLIQHSTDGKTWHSLYVLNLDTVDYTNPLSKQHSYVHVNIDYGKHYYRLVTKTKHQTTNYSQVHIINLPLNSQISVYPNPSKNQLRILGLIPNDVVLFYQSNGQLVKSLESHYSELDCDLTPLPGGIYHIHIIGQEGLKEVHQLIKMD
jgi:hypothetical protein